MSIWEELKREKVEWRKLGEVCGLITTGKLNANAMKENGEYPFFTCSAKPFKIDTYAFDMDAILISGNGSQVGHINKYKGKFNAYQRTYVLGQLIENLDMEFLYYYLTAYLKEYITINSKKGSVPYITLPMVQNFKIPIPSLETQEKIVEILHKYSLAVRELKEVLARELEIRNKQYAYYLNFILDCNNPANKLVADEKVEWKTVGELCLSITTGLNPRDNFKLNDEREGELTSWYITTKDYSSKEKIEFVEGKTAKITESARKIINKRSKLEKNDILLSSAGTVGKVAFIDVEPSNFDVNESSFVLKTDKKIINPKYLVYYLRSNFIQDEIKRTLKGSTIVGIRKQNLEKFEIPIPILETQEKIVDILDRYSIEVTNIRKNLNLEIELCQKQYEYYRGKLLSFE